MSLNKDQLLRHALATPITNILLNTQLALNICQEAKFKKNLKHYLSQTLLASKYLQSILRNQKSKQKKQTFKIMPCIEEVINICQKIKSSCQVIKYLKLDEKIYLTGNQYFFQEALICLINNAMEAYAEYAPNKVIIISGRMYQQHLELNISDGCVGMNWLKQKLAVVKGVTYKVEHSGLGLAFAKKVFCKHFAGKLDIRSKSGRGTTISIKIPIKN